MRGRRVRRGESDSADVDPTDLPNGHHRLVAYWLMKSEPDCYSIDDLERDGVGMWEGCRNYTVRNFIRDTMQRGDLAFFYHSGVHPPGIVGVMEVVGEAYADPTQFDPNSSYYDAKSPRDNPRWVVRDLRFVSKLPRIVTLAEIKSHPVLSGMEVAKRGQRLSVMPVAPEEWAAAMALF